MFSNPRTPNPKFRSEACMALASAAFDGMPSVKRPEKVYDRATGEYVAFAEPQNRGLARPMTILRYCMENAGVPRDTVDQLSAAQLASIACGTDLSNFGINLSAAESHYNVSGMFSNILLDAQNVMLRNSYDDSRTTFQMWARQADSAPDFKDIHSSVLGGVGDPKAIAEDGEFEETTMTTGKETYRLTVWGEVFSVTWQTLMNDSARALMAVPVKMVRAMKRKQNRLVYKVLKDNAKLADNIDLFHDSHGNLTTGAVTDYSAAIATMVAKLAVQTGLGEDSGALNLTGRYVLFPPALQNKIATLLASIAVPGASNDVANIYQGQFIPVMDAELGAAFGGSDVAFYMATDVLDQDTVEYCFLEGYETPRIEMQASFDRIGLRQRVYQPFAVKAVEYRGLQKHTGA